MLRKIVVMAAGASMLASLSGCLIRVDSSNEYSGNYIPPSTLSKVEEGKTTQEWITATMGEPNTKTKLDDGSEIWRYEYERTRSSSGSVFLLLDSDSRSRTRGATFVELKDGIVQKVWRD